MGANFVCNLKRYMRLEKAQYNPSLKLAIDI